MLTRLEGAYQVIEIGQRKEAEGDFRRAHHAYETAVRDFMSLALSECTTSDDLSEWLAAHPFELATSLYCKTVDHIIALPKADWARYLNSGNYLLAAFSHLFSTLGQHDRSRIFARLAAEPTLFSTRFWGEYATTLWAMLQGQCYAPAFDKLKRIETSWSSYINLMRAIMADESIDVALVEVDRQFIVRNRDNDGRHDAYMIDGSNEFPLTFDFRKAGLLAAMADAKSRLVL